MISILDCNPLTPTMKSRPSRIAYQEFFKENTLEDLTVEEGAFHPRNDLGPVPSEIGDYLVHFDIKDHPHWGLTTIRGISLVEAQKKGLLLGYFHKHGEERVYTIPAPQETYTLIPCYECGVAIKGRWD